MAKNSQKTFSIAEHKFGILSIILGSVIWSLTMVKSGLRYDFGIGFWGPNGHDGVWHISLANALSTGSYEMPIFAGEAIKNYHIGFDLFLAFLHRITSIPMSIIYFQILPFIFALLIGMLTYRFVLKWKGSKNAALWSTFFIYFAGNLGWLITLLRDGTIGGESMFWAQPAVLTLINPPFAMSLVIILLGLNLLLKLTPKSKAFYVLIAIIFGMLIQIKAYSGIIILGALFVTGIYQFWKDHINTYLKLFFVSSTVSLLIFFPNLASGSLLELKPFWFLETMMSFPDRLGWSRFGEAMVNYRLGGEWVKAFSAYFLALVIFWFGNWGTRFISKFYYLSYIKNKKFPESIDIFILSATIIGFLASMLFIQKGTAWNTIQFLYYSLFFASIISGIVFSQILNATSHKAKRTFLVLSMIAFTIPTTLGVMKHYLPSRPPAKISHEELNALEFLSLQEEGTVLVMPFDRVASEKAISNPPRPLYLYESTAYVSAYSGQNVWMEDEVNLDITGYDWQSRRNKLLEVINSNDSEVINRFLEEENIKYIYVAEGNKDVFSSLTEIYQNELINLYYYP